MTIDRNIKDKINSDREIIKLRMQAEDLINNMGDFTDEEYHKQAQKISEQIDIRIIAIVNQNN